MPGLLDEEINTALNETNQKPTEKGENPADLLRLEESDLPSQEALQSFSDVVSGESAIPPTEATIIWRHKRSDDKEPDCYTGQANSITLASGKVIASPICRQHPPPYSFKCSPNNNNKRKCKANYKTATIKVNGKDTVTSIPYSCSCA